MQPRFPETSIDSVFEAETTVSTEESSGTDETPAVSPTTAGLAQRTTPNTQTVKPAIPKNISLLSFLNVFLYFAAQRYGKRGEFKT